MFDEYTRHRLLLKVCNEVARAKDQPIKALTQRFVCEIFPSTCVLEFYFRTTWLQKLQLQGGREIRPRLEQQ